MRGRNTFTLGGAVRQQRARWTGATQCRRALVAAGRTVRLSRETLRRCRRRCPLPRQIDTRCQSCALMRMSNQVVALLNIEIVL